MPFSIDEIVNAVTLEVNDGDKGSHYEPYLDVEFSDKWLDDNTIPAGFEPGQQRLPGIEANKASNYLTEKVRELITTDLQNAGSDEAERLIDDGKIDPPDYLSDSVAEFQEENWDGMSGNDKFSWTTSNTSIIDNLQEEYDQYVETYGEQGQSVEVKVPQQFDPLQEGGSDQDYRRTQAVASYLSLQRQHQLMVERGIKESPDKAAIKSVDNQLWSAWKGSSTSMGGNILQLAAAEELGGRYRELPMSKEVIKNQANIEYSEIGGYEGIKALVRAKWEVSQFLLDKANKQVIDLYRGYKMDLPEDVKVEAVKDVAEEQNQYGHQITRDYKRLPDVGTERNGAFSTSIDSAVANKWNGGQGNTKIVLRIEAPRTSVVSLPAFGQNHHAEREVVVAGTAWRGWDAWKDRAPEINRVPIRKVA